MKTLKTIALVLFTVLAVKAQFTLEQSYNASNFGVFFTQQGVNEYYAVSNGQMSIYTSSHALITQFNLPTISGTVISYMPSKTLFDTDNDYEVMISSYETPNNIAVYNVYIFEENGSQLAHYPNRSNGGMFNTTNGTKMILSDYATQTYEVYSLPGEAYYTKVNNSDASNVIMKPYPNPAQNNITLSYQIPNGSSKATLSVINTEGVMIESIQIGTAFKNIFYDTSRLPSGMYLYTVDGQVQGKFIVQ